MFLANYDKMRWGDILPAPIIVSFLIALIWMYIPTSKAHGFVVCERSKAQCNAGDVACVAAVSAAFAACETKIQAYNIYMGDIMAKDKMGKDRPTYQFRDVYRDVLGQRYSQTNFNNVRFGFSDSQPPNNNTTDCNVIYFSNPQFVSDLRNASAHSSWHLLLHELTHTEQCTVAGGREFYAKRWWDEMEVALAAQGRKVNFLQPPDKLAAEIATLYMQGHDMMPMERAADKKADALIPELNRCCVAQGGAPIRPLTISAIQDRSDAGSIRRILSVQTANGDAPFTSRWAIKSPGDRDFIEQPQNLIQVKVLKDPQNPNTTHHSIELLWTPNNNAQNARVVTTSLEQRRVWDHEIRVRVFQQSNVLEVKDAARTISISDRVFMNLPKSGPQFEKLPAEIPSSKLPDLVPSIPEKPGPKPGPLPLKPLVGP